MNDVRVILASKSPRRRQLLAEIVQPDNIVVIDSRIEETTTRMEDNEVYTERVAKEKLKAVMVTYKGKTKHAKAIIAADTVIQCEGEIIGQPKDKEDAVKILRKLSGRWHDVNTGVAVFLTDEKKMHVFSVISRVKMNVLTERAIQRYVNTREPYDKAGAYAIQGRGKELIERYEGSYTNIVGLPMEELIKVIKGIL